MSSSPFSEIAEDSVLSIPDHVLRRRLQDETVLLNLADEEYYGLDRVGSRVYDLLDEPRSLRAVLDQLHTEFDVDLQTLTADVRAFVAEMVGARLLVVTDPSSGSVGPAGGS